MKSKVLSLARLFSASLARPPGPAHRPGPAGALRAGVKPWLRVALYSTFPPSCVTPPKATPADLTPVHEPLPLSVANTVTCFWPPLYGTGQGGTGRYFCDCGLNNRSEKETPAALEEAAASCPPATRKQVCRLPGRTSAVWGLQVRPQPRPHLG